MRRLPLLIVVLLVACAPVKPTAAESQFSAAAQADFEPAPVLYGPEDAIALPVDGEIMLTWLWTRLLEPDEFFEVRIAPPGRPLQHVTLTRESRYDAGEWLSVGDAGDYRWTVRVIKQGEEGRIEQRVSIEAEPQIIALTDAVQASPTPPPQTEMIVDIRNGFEARLYASTGQIANTVITFGEDDQLYILNLGGQIMRVVDSDGDNFAETTNIIYTDPDDALAHAVGMAIHDDGTFYVSDSGRISTVTDADGDGLLDTVTPIVEGLPSLLYPFHSNNGIAFGPDGKLYVGVGSTTDHGPDMPEPYEASILRMNPDGSDLEVFATGFRNPYDLVFSPDGDLFAGDNGPDAMNQTLRYLPPEELNHVQEGLDYGFPRAFGKTLPEGETSEPALVEFFPSVVTSGLAYYDKAHFPEHYQDGLFVVQHGTGVVPVLDRGYNNGYSVVYVWLEKQADGSYTADREHFMQFDRFRDPPARPLDVTVGPGGALYVTEWHGNIYRVTYTGD